jgi:nicotinamide-nucleotide adenylyltransferase
MRGLYIGRFQPFHNGHLELVLHIERTFHPRELLIGIGSAQVSHTTRDPFTAGERFEMVRRALDAEHLEDYWPMPIEDVDRHALWVSHVSSLLPSFDQVYSNDPLTSHLFQEAGYEVPKLPFFNRGQYEGTEIRRRMAAGESWDQLVPAAVRTFLQEIKGEERVRLLGRPAELAAHRAATAPAPDERPRELLRPAPNIDEGP